MLAAKPTIGSNCRSSVSPASPPILRVPSAMEHRVDDNLRPCDFEEDPVRKASKQGPAHRAVDALIRFRMALNGHDRLVDDCQELAARRGLWVWYHAWA